MSVYLVLNSHVSAALGYKLKWKGYHVPSAFYRWSPDVSHSDLTILKEGRPQDHNAYATRVTCPTYMQVLEWLGKFNICVSVEHNPNGSHVCVVREGMVLNEDDVYTSGPYFDYENCIVDGLTYALNHYIYYPESEKVDGA